ncbi:hypothetical protein MNBD_GAMMA12-2676 [hydrothermal vent metagenome]|uniref:Uncharacterized protein n=1 Tax=hydrothermal vent metagenome TaxID=652676 RepID=A0A3B0YNV1_9ZZZZ
MSLERNLSCFDLDETDEQLLDWGVTDGFTMSGSSYFEAISDLFKDRSVDFRVYD